MGLQEEAVAELDDVIQAYEGAGDGVREVGLIVRVRAAVERLAPRGSSYVRTAQLHEGAVPAKAGYQAISAARALRADYAAGYVRSIEELIHADVFSDFLDMASELQDKGFKDPAAVLAGSVLEEHLRKLAVRNGLDVDKPDGTPKKADTLNTDLAGAQVYNKLVQKQVTAWLGLRNSAAHGQYKDYDHAQVAALIRDARDFMVSHPA